MTIIGQVVTLRNTLNWFEQRPLFGKTVVVTRTRQQASDLSVRLTEAGAGVIEAPTIELAPPADPAAVDAALAKAGAYDWIIFTSANGVAHTKARLLAAGLDARVFGKAKVAAVGESTARAVTEELCLHVDVCPASFVTEALADELARGNAIAGKRFLLLRADIAREVMTNRLRAGGAAEIADVAVYETRPVASLPEELLEALDGSSVDWITFTSSSTAKNFFALLPRELRPRLSGVRIASIGPVTSAALQALGYPPTLESPTADVAALATAIERAK